MQHRRGSLVRALARLTYRNGSYRVGAIGAPAIYAKARTIFIEIKNLHHALLVKH
jgi:hypothetical protein